MEQKDPSDALRTGLPHFLRTFGQRKANVMWLFGAGISASAGVPTAGHMIWDFKRSIFCSEQKVPLSSFSDLSDPYVRTRIQAYLDAKRVHPSISANEEYSHYFELAFEHEADRRRYLNDQLVKGRPTRGHFILAVLAKMGKVEILWTTNFDRVLEDALVATFSTTNAIRVATSQDASIGESALADRAFPLLVKLHGDYHSTHLKNTQEELREQDANLRRLLVSSCSSRGLAVVGYSGRDDSVLEALEDVLVGASPFPGGLFWFHRADSPLPERCSRLLIDARERGVDARVLEIETFDELMLDVARHTQDFPFGALPEVTTARLEAFPVPSKNGVYPVLRLNAIPILEYPSECKLAECQIGGTAEVREAVKQAGADVIAARKQSGVLAFGSTGDLRAAFAAHNLMRIGGYLIDSKRLHYESAEFGLLYEALCSAIRRNRGLEEARGGRRRVFAASNEDPTDSLKPLKQAFGNKLFGTIPGTELTWREAVELRIEYRLDQLWLIIHPTIWASLSEDGEASSRRSAYVREQLAIRYNRRSNEIIDAWAKVLASPSAESAWLSLFPESRDPAPGFRLGSTTAYSWRTGQ